MCLKGTSVCDHCTSLRQLSSQNLVTTMMLEGVLVNSGLFSSPGLFSKAMKTNNQQRWHQCGPLSPCQLHPGCWSSNDIYWWWLGWFEFSRQCMSISHAKRSNSNATVYSLPTFCQGTGGVCWSSILGCQKILPVDILQPPLNRLPSCLKAVAFSVSSLSCNDGKTPT